MHLLLFQHGATPMAPGVLRSSEGSLSVDETHSSRSTEDLPSGSANPGCFGRRAPSPSSYELEHVFRAGLSWVRGICPTGKRTHGGMKALLGVKGTGTLQWTSPCLRCKARPSRDRVEIMRGTPSAQQKRYLRSTHRCPGGSCDRSHTPLTGSRRLDRSGHDGSALCQTRTHRQDTCVMILE